MAPKKLSQKVYGKKRVTSKAQKSVQYVSDVTVDHDHEDENVDTVESASCAGSVAGSVTEEDTNITRGTLPLEVELKIAKFF